MVRCRTLITFRIFRGKQFCFSFFLLSAFWLVSRLLLLLKKTSHYFCWILLLPNLQELSHQDVYGSVCVCVCSITADSYQNRWRHKILSVHGCCVYMCVCVRGCAGRYTCAFRAGYGGFGDYPWTPALSGLLSTYLTPSRRSPKPPPNALLRVWVIKYFPSQRWTVSPHGLTHHVTVSQGGKANNSCYETSCVSKA